MADVLDDLMVSRWPDALYLVVKWRDQVGRHGHAARGAAGMTSR